MIYKHLRILPIACLAVIALAACNTSPDISVPGSAPGSAPGGQTAGPAEDPGATTTTVVLTNEAINEASGLARSLENPGVLWLLNDSGGPTTLYATDETGADLGQIAITGVQNVDWEDLASYATPDGNRLLIADVGDNFATRAPGVQFHVIAEPPAAAVYAESIAPERTITMLYPDGPRDCEGVAVDDVTRTVWLLTKRDRPARLYRFSLDDEGTGGVVTAEFVTEVDSLPPPPDGDPGPTGVTVFDPTGFDFAPALDAAVVVTLSDLFLYPRESDEAWSDAMSREPILVDIPQFRQTEAGGFSLDGQRLIAVSEQLPAEMAIVTRP